MITSFVTLAVLLLLTVQHLACAASCKEGPDFSFRQGMSEGTDICIDGEAFAQRMRLFACLPLLLVVWLQHSWQTTPLSSHCSTLCVPDGQLIRVSSPSACFSRQHGQTGHPRSVIQKFPPLVDQMPVSFCSQASCFSHGSQGVTARHSKHSALAQ